MQQPRDDANFQALTQLLRGSRRLVVLSGAGCSTESGIPDYRDLSGAWKRKPPMTYQEFTASAAARQRYWARGSIGWRMFASVQPGSAHQVLARLEQAGRIEWLITQNVDGLHQRAGSRRVIDLHGRIDSVQCLHCRGSFARAQIQAQLDQLNPQFMQRTAAMAPDGDAQLEQDSSEQFLLVHCARCGGTLKPAVVFFGEPVPASTVARAYAAVHSADALLVVGSSLMVYSGYRFVRTACERGLPVGIVNLGTTRADALVPVKVQGLCGQVLERLETSLCR
jgi:NAD-dependent SIR2 family protein deacetylase